MLAAALTMQQAALGFLAGMDAASTPVPLLAECLQVMEQTDAVQAAGAWPGAGRLRCAGRVGS